jgi:hypothetical protein
VTVVIPTRDRLCLLERALKTVFVQEGVEIEVVVVDDGSTDGTEQWLRTLGDARLRCVRNSVSIGVAAARNRGIDAATMPWVAFLDDDDMWSPRKLVAQLDALRDRQGARWCLSAAAVADDQLRLYRNHQPPEPDGLETLLLTRNAVPGGCSGVLVQTDLVREVGGFDPSLSMMADWDLWIRLARVAPAAIVTDPLVCYVLHGANMSRDVVRSEREFAAVAAKHAARRAELGVELDRGTELWIARSAALGGARLAAARRYAALAVRMRDRTLVSTMVRALCGPEVFTRTLRRRACNLDPARRAPALATLAEVRAVTTAPLRTVAPPPRGAAPGARGPRRPPAEAATLPGRDGGGRT